MISLPLTHTLRRTRALMLILLGAALVRLYGIHAYMPTMDEVQFLIISQGRDFGEIWNRAQAEVHPPLAWFIRHYLLMLSPDMFVQRLFSVGFGLLAVIAAYALGKAVFHSRHAALCCAFAMAFMPATIIASMSLRNYGLFLLFLTGSFVFFIRWQNKGKAHNLLLYILFICCACSSHFSGFLVAAAFGMTQGFRLLLFRRFYAFALFCISHLPLAALGMLFYVYYLAPGTTIPMWKEFMLRTGFTPLQPETGLVAQLVIPLLAYFTPFLQAVRSEGFIHPALLPLAQTLLLLAGIMLFMLYTVGMNILRKQAPATFDLTLMLWLITLSLSFADLYPFSANRHTLYLLPFLIVPFAALLLRPIAKLSTSPYALRILIVCMGIGAAADEAVIWRDEDFCLKMDDFERAQTYLHARLAPGDAIVTGPMGAYFYLIYAQGHGLIAYNDYTDKPYAHGATLLAPFASPYKPYSSWQPFRDELARRMNGREGTVWFVQYGWKNQELWTLMQCGAAQPLMQNFMSREGVVIFSMKATALAAFLQNTQAWNECYKEYKPLVIGTPFHQVTP